MPKTQSDALLTLVRSALARRKWNTAALALEMKRDRAEIRAILAGRTPLLVDDFFAMVEVLHLGPDELGLPASFTQAPAEEPVEEKAPAEKPLGLLPPVEGMEPDEDEGPDPDAPQAEQLFRLGFELGVDMLFISDPEGVKESGVPASVLAKFPKGLLIRLDAPYHRHNRARYEPEGIELRLSFDRVYTCFFPYSAIQQMVFFPAPPVLAPDEESEETPVPKGRPTLTLVKS